MKYIVYRLNDLRVINILSTQIPEQHPGFYHKFGIAEYNGEIPTNDWLTVDNIREEKEIVDNYDENGNLVSREIEVEYSKTHIVCDLVAHFYQKREFTEEQKKENEKQKLRQLREKECFAFVNRGEVWYKRLTEEQKTELDVWYQAWLDVTETFKIPDSPNWLK